MVARPYMKTITTTTAGGSTELPSGLKILKIVNIDATNFTTLSIDEAIGGAGDEATLLATKEVDFTNAGMDVGGNALTLYWKSDTADVDISIFGYIY